MLSHVAQGSDRIAVIDVETTGVYPSDRVLEVGVITMTLEGNIVDKWETLVSPGRDVGPTHLHGITAGMLANAPRFDDIAGDLADRLHGAILAGHNIMFDQRFIASELERVGLALEGDGSSLCTLRLSGAKLAVACAQHGISLIEAHRAIADAEATAQLLLKTADKCDAPVGPVHVTGQRPPHLQQILTRDATDRPTDAPTPPLIVFLADRLGHTTAQPDLLPYLDILDRAISDLHLDREERVELDAIAAAHGLDARDIARAHRTFLNDLIDAAAEDRIVTDEEYDTLLRVAAALEVDAELVEERTTALRSNEDTVRLTPGGRVVFTGNAPGHTRDELEAVATEWGLEASKNVTKSTIAVVAADPDSRSGKAKKAHGWGIPIIGVQQFLDAGPDGEIGGQATSGRLRVVECPVCHATTTEPSASGGVRNKPCADCT